MRRKILFIHHAIGMGGAPISLSCLIAGLSKERFQVYVVMPKRAGNDAVKQLFKNAGAEVIEEKHIRPFHGVNGCRCDSFRERAYALLSAFPTAWATRNQVRYIEPDLVHLNTSVLPFAALGARLSGLNVPVVTHVREVVLKNWWGRMLSFFNRQFSDWHVGIDQSGLNRIGVSKERSTVVHNSCDAEAMTLCEKSVSELRRRFNCQQDTVLFTSICRIAKSNGTLELANALAQHSAELPSNVRFVFCGFEGNGTEYAEEARAAISQSEHVFAMDFTNGVANLIGASDVVMAPFVSAHSARVVIEGALLGKPALVTDFPNLREQISENKTGLVFRFDQLDTLIDAIRRFADRNKTAEMGEAAREFAELHYSLEKNVAKIEDLYSKILKCV